MNNLLIDHGVEIPPTEDELPYSDGVPLESERHLIQPQLLKDILLNYWTDKKDYYIGINMFVYFSLKQIKTMDFRGPDFFIALDVEKRERKSWVLWQEEKGPDIVIEFLSESTKQTDFNEKKFIYQDKLRVSEYYLYHPFTADFTGFKLIDGKYELMEADNNGFLYSEKIDLYLVKWKGVYQGIDAVWLRWMSPEKQILMTGEEKLIHEINKIENEKIRANNEKIRANNERIRADNEKNRADNEKNRADKLAKQLIELGINPDVE